MGTGTQEQEGPVALLVIMTVLAFLPGFRHLPDAGAEAVAEPQILWRAPFECVNPGLPTGWGHHSGGSCPEDFALEDDEHAPGGKCMRISSPVLVRAYGASAANGTPVIWSSLMRADDDGVEAAIYTSKGEKKVELTEEWRRYSVVSVFSAARWNPFYFGWRGPKSGTVRAAAPQLEVAAAGSERRAAGWGRSFECDYAVDADVAGSGKQSLCCAERGGATQVGVFEKALVSPLVLTGRCRTLNVANNRPPRITLRLYAQGDADDAKPDAAGTLTFPGGSHDWEGGRLSVNPKVAVRRFSVSIENTSGTVWFDDLALSAGAEEEDLDAMVAELEEAAGKGNCLKNAGFETTVMRPVVSRDARPSQYVAPELPWYAETRPDPPEEQCAVVTDAPVIDGVLGEACWAEATKIDRFVEIIKGAPANPAISATLCRDKGSLYIGFQWKAEPAGQVVGVLLKPELLHPGRKFFDFSIACDGEKVEGKGFEHRFGNGRKFFKGGLARQGWGFYTEWSQPWIGKAVCGDKSWTAEFAIPLSSLEANLDNDFWGLNLYARTGKSSVDTKTYAWSPVYRDLHESRRRAGWREQHPRRTKGTHYYYGRLLGMKGMTAAAPYANMLRLSHRNIGLECLPDDSVGVHARVGYHRPLAGKDLEVELTATLSGETRKKAFVLRRPQQILRIGGFSAKRQNGAKHSVFVTITPKGRDLVLAHESTSRVLDPRYNSLLASVRLRTQLSYYTTEKQTRVLVENNLPTRIKASFSAVQDNRRIPIRVPGNAELDGGEKRYLPIDIAGLPVGDWRIEGEFVDGSGKPVAKAFDRLTKAEPVNYGVQLNRVTGCLKLGGKWQIGRMGWGTKEQGFNAINARHSRDHYDKAWASGKYIGGAWFSGQNFHPSLLERIPKTMRELRDHPGLGYWYLIDEAKGPYEELYQRARKADPYHPINTGGPLRYTDMLTGCCYPFGLNRVWSTPWNYSLEHTAVRYDAAHGRPALEVGAPVSMWLSFIQGNNPNGRPPTPDEFRAQVYAGLVYNQRIFKYWIARPYYKPIRERIAEVHRELDLFQDFLAGDDAVLLCMDRKDNIHVALWRNENGLCLVAVNCTPWPMTTTLDLAEFSTSATNLIVRAGEEDCAGLRTNRLHLKLNATQRAIVLLR